jgi:hypothetical protein
MELMSSLLLDINPYFHTNQIIEVQIVLHKNNDGSNGFDFTSVSFF